MNRVTFSTTSERPAAPALDDERFIRLAEVLATCGKSRSSIYEGVKEGTFPAPVKFQGCSSAWLKSEVLQWMQACVTARRSASGIIQAAPIQTVAVTDLKARAKRQPA